MDERDDMRRRLDTVWKMASSGFDTLKEVVVRSSQAGRLRVDLALYARQRAQLLQILGEQVCALIGEEQLEVPDEVRALYDHVREIEQRMRADAVKAHDNAFGAPRGYEPEAYEGEPEDQDGEP